MVNLRVIILAAGKGVRMNSDMPKVLHQVCGKPIIDYVLDAVRFLGPAQTSVVVGHKGRLVERYLDKKYEIVNQKKLLGTADAIACSEAHFRDFDGNVLILCGDVPLLKKETIQRLIQTHQDSRAACTFVTAHMDNAYGYGRVIRGLDGSVAAIREENDASPGEKQIKEINSGAYCFSAKFLFSAVKEIKRNSKKKEFYLTDIVSLLVGEDKKVETLSTDDPCEALGVNTREDLAVIENLMREKTLKKLMAQGVTIVDPQTTFIDADVKIGRDTVIRPFTIIDHNVCVGSHCIIGPFCHIRSGTRIGSNNEIGNFTELSKVTMGDGCFMKHFSFLGNTAVGKKVNIGAGTITANFDGKRKNNTRIGDGTFVGCDSILIAPLTIGKNAVTGAGSVVTKKTKVPDASLLLGIPAKVIPRRKK